MVKYLLYGVTVDLDVQIKGDTEHQTEAPTASAWPAGSRGQHLPVRADELDQVPTGSQRDTSVSARGLPMLQL